MNKDSGEILGKEMRKVIQNQMDLDEPKIVNPTFNRLIDAGISKEEAIRMMAHCLTIEIYDMQKEERSFNEKRYTKMFETLPDEEKIYDV